MEAKHEKLQASAARDPEGSETSAPKPTLRGASAIASPSAMWSGAHRLPGTSGQAKAREQKEDYPLQRLRHQREREMSLMPAERPCQPGQGYKYDSMKFDAFRDLDHK